MTGIPQYTLYYSPGAASMVIHLALLEIGVPYERVLVDFDSKAQHTPSYLKLNPHGVVPTLLIDGQPFVESVALLLMLAERHPESNLAPEAGSEDRNAWFQWLAYLGNTLGANYRFWFYPGDLGKRNTHPLCALRYRRISKRCGTASSYSSLITVPISLAIGFLRRTCNSRCTCVGHVRCRARPSSGRR